MEGTMVRQGERKQNNRGGLRERFLSGWHAVGGMSVIGRLSLLGVVAAGSVLRKAFQGRPAEGEISPGTIWLACPIH